MNANPFRKLCLYLAILILTGIPAFAQMDLSGQWAPVLDEDRDERVGGPELGEYMGMPINEVARWRAELWDSSIQSLPEWQCRPHGVDYITRGPSHSSDTRCAPRSIRIVPVCRIPPSPVGLPFPARRRMA